VWIIIPACAISYMLGWWLYGCYKHRWPNVQSSGTPEVKP
jgi:hypothetical protein